MYKTVALTVLFISLNGKLIVFFISETCLSNLKKKCYYIQYYVLVYIKDDIIVFYGVFSGYIEY